MNIRDDKQYRLDALLSGIEDELFRTEDLTILSDDEDKLAHVEHVRALIQSQVGTYTSGNYTKSNIEKISFRSQSRQCEIVPMTVPEGVDARRQLLEAIVGSHSNIPNQIRAAFSAKNKPTDTAIDDMVTDLIRIGVLKRADTDA